MLWYFLRQLPLMRKLPLQFNGGLMTDDENYEYYQGPFNLHIDLTDSEGNEIDGWTQHICNYCCGECPTGSSTCPYNSEYSCDGDPQCVCSSTCCYYSGNYSCCGYQANENDPYEYRFTRNAPEIVGNYTLEVQIVASCLTETKGNSKHNLLVASEEGELEIIPEFSTIAIPVGIALLAALMVFRRQ
ncbi:MAG TPA: PEF-CTERM sorting domain-containing protein [Archaeoglobaceae archaeon]|nr:PEF-CTERM sorting domain-containing protein [Archaeoglobaceae archaeon]